MADAQKIDVTADLVNQSVEVISGNPLQEKREGSVGSKRLSQTKSVDKQSVDRASVGKQSVDGARSKPPSVGRDSRLNNSVDRQTKKLSDSVERASFASNIHKTAGLSENQVPVNPSVVDMLKESQVSRDPITALKDLEPRGQMVEEPVDF